MRDYLAVASEYLFINRSMAGELIHSARYVNLVE